jgi:diguanylate cyclase (GGDEF)-like protein
MGSEAPCLAGGIVHEHRTSPCLVAARRRRDRLRSREEAMAVTPLRPRGAAPEPRRKIRTLSTRLSLGGYLVIALAAVLFVLLAGMRFAQQSTRETAALVGSVETRYEPVLRLSRELGEAVIVFDRQVLEMSEPASGVSADAVKASGERMLSIVEEFARLAPSELTGAESRLRLRLRDLQRQGFAIAELDRQRSAAAHRSLVALDGLAARTERAGNGVESGDQVLARKSLADLSRSAAALRASTIRLFAAPSAASAADANRDRAAFAALLQAHAAELARSPGGAWLELERDDSATASGAAIRFLATEQRIEAARDAADALARELATLIQTELQRPAWNALTDAAAHARITAERAERHLANVAIAILVVLLAVAAAIGYGIIGPARRLLDNTRSIARGRLDSRTERGGVRELDELAAAFNDMAEALATTQQALQEQQLALEDRVAERTGQLQHLANHDPLTGLPNRRELAVHLAAAIERTQRGTAGCAVFYIDIDNFKTINDSLGHLFGDSVLRAIGARFRETAGETGFLARLGGDEFTLVIEGISSAAAAEAFVGGIMGAFQQPICADQRSLLVSLSIGVAVCPEHGDTAEELLRAADSALFDAKDRGRNGFSIYRAELLAAASHRFHTEQGLRHALEAGDLLLHFQPEVSLMDAQTTVVEALLRWRQPGGRIAPAGEFITIAEQSGLSLELGGWVLRSALEAARQLRASVWPQAKIAVNVSAQQFLTGRFVESVERALRVARMPADCLEIELTESALQTGRLVVDALHDLRRIGVAVALDDFGAGYSSLKSIEELPLTRVKLDRGLTGGIATTASAAAIANSVIRLCQGLRLTVTAEGIERPDQLDFLSAYGEVHVQGYLIARPAPMDEVARFVSETPARMASVWRRAQAMRDDGSGSIEQPSVALFRPRGR